MLDVIKKSALKKHITNQKLRIGPSALTRLTKYLNTHAQGSIKSLQEMVGVVPADL